MLEDKLLQSSRCSDKNKKKKKKRKKASASTSPPESTEKPQAESLPPETSPVSPQCPSQPPGQLPRLRTTNKKDGELLAGSGRKSKRRSKDSPSLLTAANKTSGSGSPAQGCAAELSAQARETLRWEGVLEDPQAEEKRLELYRANRRQRYMSHREALLKEAQHALKQTFPKESKQKTSTSTGSERQEQRLFHRLKQT